MFKKQNGITLVALVVTIIVLIILAGVTLMIALDDEGIISKTKEGAQEYNTAQEQENKMLNDVNTILKKY